MARKEYEWPAQWPAVNRRTFNPVEIVPYLGAELIFQLPDEICAHESGLYATHRAIRVFLLGRTVAETEI